MATNGLLINYQYCTGCHSCEVACKNALKLPRGKSGIKLLENGPWEVTPEKFEWDYIPVPTQLCNLCADRVEEGKKPSCVHHCLAQCIEYGSAEELAARAAELGEKTAIFFP
ncbi:4Fe-4S dicluster domain-containing protein [Desulfuromonas acetoxidans]|uniref:4Fe-4S ferredoxin, iron-sulfur binding n=1 Tax=Desulfuromonas acetoxidans (strain DSM 684 / 11070) TaxID=281689 RepID=Q1JWL8_DESA6|nr:4Fe-4S dicluster domain-containing protein [Desulfuromonas acetoxidans]EAT14661.1 4Fe-4S ferredoxin, iron-sulfur binding [Desulfuromonas acetoxidans DSM 684]MBF0645047.1 oxidoreductase [Desulfuromonas acetoxidans]NVD23143.1 oxidoreductase [Desulfuromonas acetoxidans]NVE15616.1 oxidoreductase [Desulfuromonas acetoxidans]